MLPTRPRLFEVNGSVSWQDLGRKEQSTSVFVLARMARGKHVTKSGPIAGGGI
jgi:hypothetical protein